MDDDFRQSLIDAKDKDEVLRLVDEAENKKVAETQKKEAEAKHVAPGTYRFLAVTACPTGIAHTYMAAESLEEKAKEMGVTIKVETNGSGGKKNVLTPAEISAADGIIVAADTKVDMPRFNGKPVIQTQVSDGISRPQELIQTILDGKAPVDVYQRQHHGLLPLHFDVFRIFYAEGQFIAAQMQLNWVPHWRNLADHHFCMGCQPHIQQAAAQCPLPIHR